MLGALLRAVMIRRLFAGANRRRGHRRSRRHARDGFGFTGPFPAYSHRTRRGSRVTVTGCCLPIPLALALAPAALLAVKRRR